MERFLGEESMTRIARDIFMHAADSSDGADHYAPAERLEDVITEMGLGLEGELKTQLQHAVCEHGRVAQTKFVEELSKIWSDNPTARQSYASLLRRRQLEERAEIEAVFALYDLDGKGSILHSDLTAALGGCGWELVQVQLALKNLEIDMASGGGVDAVVTLDSFVACVLKLGVYKSTFAT